MKAISRSIVVIALVLFALPAIAEKPGKELVERFLEVTMAKEGYEYGLVAGFDAAANEDVMKGMPEEMKENYVKGFAEVKELMLERMGWDKVKDEIVVLMQDAYQTEELEAAVEAFDTPIMQQFAAKQLVAMQAMMEFGQVKAMELMPEIEAIMMRAMTE